MQRCKTWIIDADIARAAGTTEYPTSRNCRSFLDFIKNNNLEMKADPITRQEWRKHQSLYASKWFANMVARKKMHFINNSIDVNRKIEESGVTEKAKKIAQKDSHLIQTSLEHNVTIASGDDTARNAFCDISLHYAAIKGLIWVNPKTNCLEIIDSYQKNLQIKLDWRIGIKI